MTGYDEDDLYEDERDYHQEHKDGVAMGYINEDGSYREPDPTDVLEAQALEEDQEHRDTAHGGGPCDCGMIDLDSALARGCILTVTGDPGLIVIEDGKTREVAPGPESYFAVVTDHGEKIAEGAGDSAAGAITALRPSWFPESSSWANPRGGDEPPF